MKKKLVLKVRKINVLDLETQNYIKGQEAGLETKGFCTTGGRRSCEEDSCQATCKKGTCTCNAPGQNPTTAG